MTIDEAIARERQLAKEQRSHIGTWDKEYSKKCEEYAEEHEQLAEWLEELKCYKNDNDFSDYADRLHKIAFSSGYNKAIDDLLEDANEMAIEVDTGTYTMKAIGIGLLGKIAEKLKEGGKNE